MNERSLQKTNKKLSENDIVISILNKLMTKKDAPTTEIAVVLNWLKDRQKTLNLRFDSIFKELCEEADLLVDMYEIEEKETDCDETY